MHCSVGFNALLWTPNDRKTRNLEVLLPSRWNFLAMEDPILILAGLGAVDIFPSLLYSSEKEETFMSNFKYIYARQFIMHPVFRLFQAVYCAWSL